VTSTPLSTARRASLAVALALLIAAPATADVVRWSRLDGAASARLASGPSSWVAWSNVKRTSALAPESWWGNDSSWNRYSYVENNPVNASDPTGELGFLATALVGGLVDAGFQVAINAIEGKTGGELLEGTGKAFVQGAVIGATGYGLAKLGARALQVGRRVGQATEGVSRLPTSVGAARNAVYNRLEGSLARHGGELVEGGARFPSRRAARQAASEIAGDMGSEVDAIRASSFRGGPRSWRNSNRVIGRKSADGTVWWRDDVLGHSRFDMGAHVNVSVNEIELHLFY
jgi:hypothetical protein